MQLSKNSLQYCHDFVEGRLVRIHKNIQNIQHALQSETKSSAGDKHETGRAMLQLEREKLGQQLAEAEKMKQVLSRVKLQQSDTIGLGSLVHTTTGMYFIAISAGAFQANQESIVCISAATPIGKLLMGKQQGESIVFNQKAIEVLQIL